MPYLSYQKKKSILTCYDQILIIITSSENIFPVKNIEKIMAPSNLSRQLYSGKGTYAKFQWSQEKSGIF